MKGTWGTKRTRGARGTYRSHRTLQEPNLYPFVLVQIFAVFFTIAKNSAKNYASVIFPQIFSQKLAQIFAEINAVQKIPQIFAILFAVIIALRKYYRKTKRKYLRIANKSAKKKRKKAQKKAKNTYGSLLLLGQIVPKNISSQASQTLISSQGHYFPRTLAPLKKLRSYCPREQGPLSK